ncbi:MAG: hypothetical protein MAG453_01919 [Calditrichaeota bacterium]|nr:hypothetical protein [Calditrichota bacterium]
MKKQLLVFCVAAVLLFAFGATATAQPGSFVIGWVTDADLGTPVQGATVIVGSNYTMTSPTGHFIIEGLEPGPNPYYVCHPDYAPAAGTTQISPGHNELYVDLEPDPFDDAVIWAPDPTPGNAEQVETILNEIGINTVYTTQYDEVEWTNYEYLFVFLGIYPNDYWVQTGSAEESALIDYLDQGGNLYLEGGNVYGYNPPENLLDMLNLTDINDGSDDLTGVYGVDCTWMSGVSMDYDGENNYIDHISAGGGAMDLLYNPADMAGCGVVDNSMDFNTACFSFEVGGLVDQLAFTRQDLLTGLLAFWIGGGGPVPLEVTLTPVTETIPAEGGVLEYDAEIMNYTGVMQSGQAWTEVTLPNGNLYGPLLLTFVNLPAGGTTVTGLTQNVPDTAPAGEYTFWGSIGAYPFDVAVAWDSFFFEKEEPAGASASGVDDWSASDWNLAGNLAGDAGREVELPDRFKLTSVRPNPFNPATTISLALPEGRDVRVAVFSALGREVAELENGRLAAGEHAFAFDASGLASGIYFVRATAGTESAMRKIVLMK